MYGQPPPRGMPPPMRGGPPMGQQLGMPPPMFGGPMGMAPQMYPPMMGRPPPMGTPLFMGHPPMVAPPPSTEAAVVVAQKPTTSTVSREKACTVYVGKISPDVDDEHLQKILGLCGVVTRWRRIKDPDTNKFKTFGFCEYGDEDSVLRAVRLLHEYDLDGSPLLLKINEDSQRFLDQYVSKKKEELVVKRNKEQQESHEEETKKRAQNKEEGDAADKAELPPPPPRALTVADIEEDYIAARDAVDEEVKAEVAKIAKAAEKAKSLLDDVKSDRERERDRRDRDRDRDRGRGDRDRDRGRERETKESREERDKKDRERRRKRREDDEERRTKKREADKEKRYKEQLSRWEEKERKRIEKYENMVVRDGERAERKERAKAQTMLCIEDDYEEEERDEYYFLTRRKEGRERERRRQRRKDREKEEMLDERDRRKEEREDEERQRLLEQMNGAAVEKVEDEEMPSESAAAEPVSRKRGRDEDEAVALSLQQAKRPRVSSGIVFEDTTEDEHQKQLEEQRSHKQLKKLEYTPEQKLAAFNAKRTMAQQRLRSEIASTMTDATVIVGKKEMAMYLIARIPTDKDALFAYEIDYEAVEMMEVIEKKLRPWIAKNMKEYLGSEEPEFVKLIVQRLTERTPPDKLQKELSSVLDEDAPTFLLKLWRKFAFEVESAANGVDI